MKEYYECHITMAGDRDYIKKWTEHAKLKFSCIDGDINLGDGVKCYATIQFSKNRYLQQDVIKLVQVLVVYFEKLKIKVLRSKVELIIYDNRG